MYLIFVHLHSAQTFFGKIAAPRNRKNFKTGLYQRVLTVGQLVIKTEAMLNSDPEQC